MTQPRAASASIGARSGSHPRPGQADIACGAEPRKVGKLIGPVLLAGTGWGAGAGG